MNGVQRTSNNKSHLPVPASGFTCLKYLYKHEYFKGIMFCVNCVILLPGLDYENVGRLLSYCMCDLYDSIMPLHCLSLYHPS